VKTPKIVSTDDVTPQTRKSPAEELIESVGDGYLTMKKMALRYGVHIETMRRLCKLHDKDGNKVFKAPTSAIQQGGLVIYLFNEEDVAEVDDYMADRGHPVVR
jgi:hypothetical protein